MIQFVDTEELKNTAFSFCQKKLCGTRIASFLDSYGYSYQFARFWVQKKDDNITAVLSCVDGAASLEANDEADFEELAMFLPFAEMKTLFSKRSVAEKLSVNTISASFSMEYVNKNEESFNELKIISNPDLKSVYSCLAAAFLKKDLPSFEDWLPDVSFRIRRETAEAFLLQESGVDASAAMAVAKSNSSVVLGGVATKPEFRNRGYAGHMVQRLSAFYTRQNKKVFLCCDENKVNFYKNLGFAPGEEYSISILK